MLKPTANPCADCGEDCWAYDLEASEGDPVLCEYCAVKRSIVAEERARWLAIVEPMLIKCEAYWHRPAQEQCQAFATWRGPTAACDEHKSHPNAEHCRWEPLPQAELARFVEKNRQE